MELNKNYKTNKIYKINLLRLRSDKVSSFPKSESRGSYQRVYRDIPSGI